ncbi:MAG: RNA-directed DNA polymerase [Proteobacteria bacterium]|nr:MAG: RNA-directed DNA polymerase [Pseudomonadota bacterium]QKK10354.1 MAG: RNA-directed DNA polymerase [Pseudomonadota bacterium]
MIVKRIAQETGLDSAYLDKVVRTASHRYKTYKIAKKNGGLRIISHPAKELKFLQRWLVSNLFCHLPIHSAVFSYREGRNIKQLAETHIANNFLLRIDFEGFFPSILVRDVSNLLKNSIDVLPFQLSRSDVNKIGMIVCKDGRITIGAPSSPMLSNAILFNIDTEIADACVKKGVVYTRYADDLYFSTNEPMVLQEVFEGVKGVLRKNKSPKIRINAEKTIFTSRKHKKMVTGLYITPDRRVSIGRQKKRAIKALVYSYINQSIAEEDMSYLRGYLSYIKSVEPGFLRSLEKKYGQEVLQKIMIHEYVKRK